MKAQAMSISRLPRIHARRGLVIAGSLVATWLCLPACGSGGGGTPPGIYCNVKGSIAPVCYGYSNLDAEEQAAVSETCTEALQGTIASSCPGGSVGCCTTTVGYTTTECYYAGTAATLSADCKASNGTWAGSEGDGGAGGGASQSSSGGTTQSSSGGTTQSSSGGTTQSSSGSSGCSGNDVVCPAGCADLNTDPKNCGSCEHACDPGPSGTLPACAGGACTLACASAGKTYCDIDQLCVDLSQGVPCTGAGCGQDGISDCGGCGNNCPTNPCGTATCTNGSCGFTPDPTTNGKACYAANNGPPGMCQSGTCEPVLVACDITSAYGSVHGYGTYASDFGLNDLAQCTCSGDTLEISYLVGSGPTSISCGLCASGTFSNLNANVACFQGGCGAASCCTSDANCSGATPVCDTATQSCVACTQDAQCTTPPMFCADATHAYVGSCSGEACSYAAGPGCLNGCWLDGCNTAGPSFDGDAYPDPNGPQNVSFDKEPSSSQSQGYAPAGIPVTVYVALTPPNAATGVTLTYSTTDFQSDSGTPVTCAFAGDSGSDELWRATIPAQSGVTVGFYFAAQPRNGSAAIYLPGNFINYTYMQ